MLAHVTQYAERTANIDAQYGRLGVQCVMYGMAAYCWDAVRFRLSVRARCWSDLPNWVWYDASFRSLSITRQCDIAGFLLVA
jgi:hypothetical protein